MKIEFLWLGYSKNKQFEKIIDEYLKRLSHYTKSSIISLKEPKAKNRNEEETKKTEATTIISKLKKSDYVVLLDERGKHLNSVEFSQWLQHKMNISITSIVFVIAGAMGAHQLLKERADYILSISPMTLTHDMVRIFILEQTYRAFTIIKGEKYHNE